MFWLPLIQQSHLLFLFKLTMRNKQKERTGEEGHLALFIYIKARHIIFLFSRLFQKVDQWMSKDEQQDNDARKKLEDANQV